jgi:hypothetical protein
VDIEVILDAAESEAPGLFLEAETRHLGVPLDPASVLAQRTEEVPEVHVTGPSKRDDRRYPR